MTSRIAFRMKLKAGRVQDYEQRHANIFPEMVQALRDAGVRDYSIWHDAASDDLFAVMAIDDPAALDAVRRSDVAKRWWAHMEDTLETNANGTPVQVSLRRVFRLASQL